MAGVRLLDVERVLFAVGEGADCRGTAVRDARVCTLSEAGFAGFFWIFRMGEDLLTQVRSYERWTRDGERLREIMSVCECLCVLGGLSGAGFAGFFGIFRMGEDLLTQVGSYERWTRDGERLREITSVCECLRVLGGLGGAEFAGFIGIFRMGEDLLTQVRSYERWTSVCERLRVFTCFGWIGWSRICRIYWDFQDGGGPADAGGLVRALDESLRAFTRDHERLRVFMCVGWIGWSRICRIYWDFQDGGGPADAGGLVRALDESLRAFTRDHERLRVFMCVGWIGWSRICRIYWDFQDGGGPADAGGLVRALDESLRAFTRDHERLRVFTCVGWVVWSRICRIFWDFQDGGGPAGTGALVRALDERLRAFTRDHKRFRALGGLSGAGFAGFFGIFGMVNSLLTLVRLYERSRALHDRS